MPLTSLQKKIAEEIKRSTQPGERRNVLLFRNVYGKKVVPSDRDFVEQAIKVKNKDTGLPSHWVFNRPQRLLSYTRQRRIKNGQAVRDAILKARQWGISTYMLGEGHALVLRHDDFPAAIVANKGTSSQRLLSTARWQSQKLPIALPRKYANRSELHYGEPWNSFLEIDSAESDEPLRSGTFRWVHCSETAFWPNPERSVAAINAVVPKRPGTYLSHESTANGVGNWWHGFWWGAKKGENDYWGWFFPWWFDPEFDYSMPVTEAEVEEIADSLDDEERWLVQEGVGWGGLKWRRHTLRNEYFGDLDLFHQEFPARPEEAFLSTGRPVFNQKKVMTALLECRKPTWRGNVEVGPDKTLILSDHARGDLSIWETPYDGAHYCMGIDVADGVGQDYTVITILNMETLVQAATWVSNRLEPFKAGQIAALLGWKYGTAYCLPEMKGAGLVLCRSMQEFGYNRIGRRTIFDARSKTYEERLGFDTNVKTKPVAIEELRMHLAMETLGIRDSLLCGEMQHYAALETPGGSTKFSAPKGKHDDRIMSMAIALVARKDAYVQNVVGYEPPKVPRNYTERVHAILDSEDGAERQFFDERDPDWSVTEAYG